MPSLREQPSGQPGDVTARSCRKAITAAYRCVRASGHNRRLAQNGLSPLPGAGLALGQGWSMAVMESGSRCRSCGVALLRAARASKLSTLVAGLLGCALLSLPLAVPAMADPATSAAGQPTQWIVVGVPSANATTGTLTAFQRVGQGWKAVLGPTAARVGELGVGAPADGVHRTPVGTFAFDQAFGRQPNPGTKMPYFQATDQDWWDEEADSPTYNTHVRQSGSPSSIAENLHDSGPVYDYAVNIAVNPRRIPGRLSGIFLHVTDGSPTWGCVAIGHDEMRSVLNWLDPSASPRITIGVGTPMTATSGW